MSQRACIFFSVSAYLGSAAKFWSWSGSDLRSWRNSQGGLLEVAGVDVPRPADAFPFGDGFIIHQVLAEEICSPVGGRLALEQRQEASAAVMVRPGHAGEVQHGRWQVDVQGDSFFDRTAFRGLRAGVVDHQRHAE